MTEAERTVGAITEALRRSVGGDARETDELMALVYDELRGLARNKMAAQAPGQTLQTTALVHEAWMRIADSHRKGWDNRAHFFGAASRAMRNILVDQARRKQAQKRDGSVEALEADEMPEFEAPAADEMLALDEALGHLEKIDPRKARVVMLRFFTGLSVEAVAEVIDVSIATVERDWRFARAWLQDQIENFSGLSPARGEP